MHIRPFHPRDLRAVAHVFTEAVHVGAAGHYDEAQRAAWAPRPPDLAWWRRRVEGVELLVAEVDGEVRGFLGYVRPGYVDLLFVAPTHHRQGLASALYAKAEAAFVARGAVRAHTEASLVARPFFARHGFRVMRGERVAYRGATFQRYVMDKILEA
ncbi:MAG: GNAT family N-acetyltransferase [Bacteroidota bacterium]